MLKTAGEKAWDASQTTMNADHTSYEAVYTLSTRGVASFPLTAPLALSGERRTSAAKNRGREVRGTVALLRMLSSDKK